MKHFISAVKDNYANFKGRMSREEFWMFVLFYAIFSVILSVIDVTLGIPGVLSSLYGLVLFIPSFAAYVRRLHDTGTSGHMLWICITIIGVFWIFYLCLKKSDEGMNKYDI
jgi:uncharacterized membrane protein YhaH (DUF805 family)